MSEMMVDIVKWAASVGTAAIVLGFVGVIVWRIVLGTKTKPGLWDDYRERTGRHEAEQTRMAGLDRQHARAQDVHESQQAASMLLLTDAQEPPAGPAYIAQEQVAQTAAKVEQIHSSVLQYTKALRLIGTQFPDVRDEIEAYCEQIDRLTEAD